MYVSRLLGATRNSVPEFFEEATVAAAGAGLANRLVKVAVVPAAGAGLRPAPKEGAG